MIEEIHGPGGITDGEVRVATRKGWHEWVEILDAWNTHDKYFNPTLRYLVKLYGLNYQWAKTIAVYYVREHSLGRDLSRAEV